MTRTRRVPIVLAATLLALPALAGTQDSILVEWADRGRDPTFAGGAVFQRTLSCAPIEGHDRCELLVISISHSSCPAVLSAAAFRTEDGNLKVRRSESAVDLEFTEARLATWTLHLAVGPSPLSIVEQASGSVTIKPLRREDRVETMELVTLARSTRGLEGRREFAEVELKCAKVAVVAAKR